MVRKRIVLWIISFLLLVLAGLLQFAKIDMFPKMMGSILLLLISIALLLVVELKYMDLDDGIEGKSEENGRVGEADKEEGIDESNLSRTYRLKSLFAGKKVIDGDDIDSVLDNIRIALIENDVNVEVVDELLEDVRNQMVGETEKLGTRTENVVNSALQESMVDILQESSEDFLDEITDGERPYTIVFVGVNGVGKTTTIAKISKYLNDNGFSTVIANGDTYRAGAQEQIEEHAERVDTKLISHEDGGDPTSVIYDAVEFAEANDIDVVLGDTAGRLSTNDDLMNQIEKIERVIEPENVVLVDEAVAGQDVVKRAQEFAETVPLNGIILTKADANKESGAIVSLPYTIGKPIYFLGVGQDYDDLEQFDPEKVASELLK